MNKVKSTARITEVDGLSDSVIRIFGADTKAQEDTFLKGQIAELTTLSDAITASILQDKAVTNLDEADSRRDEAVRKSWRASFGLRGFSARGEKNCGSWFEGGLRQVCEVGNLERELCF